MQSVVSETNDFNFFFFIWNFIEIIEIVGYEINPHTLLNSK